MLDWAAVFSCAMLRSGRSTVAGPVVGRVVTGIGAAPMSLRVAVGILISVAQSRVILSPDSAPDYESLQGGELLTVVLFVWLVSGRGSRGGRLRCTYRRIQRVRRHRRSGLCQGYNKRVGREARVLCASSTKGWRREDTSATFGQVRNF